jgi:hypothetical protein
VPAFRETSKDHFVAQGSLLCEADSIHMYILYLCRNFIKLCNTILALEMYMHACRKYPYFDVTVGLAWSKHPESYAGGSIATGRGSHAGQV